MVEGERHPIKTGTLIITLAWLASTGGVFATEPLGTAITYQGRLADGGSPAQGSYDLRCTLFDHPTAGQVVGRVLTNAATEVTDGMFLLSLDFEAPTPAPIRTVIFNGEARWLEIGVRTNGSRGDFTPLKPRQRLMPVPYALYAPSAATVPAAGVVGVLPDARLSANVARLDGSAAFDGSVAAADALRAPRLQIGLLSEAGPDLATIAGGLWNTNLGAHSFVGQGITNTIQGNTRRAFLGGGTGNTIQRGADDSVLGGGGANTIQSNATRTVLGGGFGNRILAGADDATVGGGMNNTAGDDYATVPGGADNAALGTYSLAAGRRAKAEHSGAFVWADSSPASFHSSLEDQFAVRARGGMYVEGSGGFSAPQLHLRQTSDGNWARLRFSVVGVSNFWNISMQPDKTPELHFSNLTNSIVFGVDGRVKADSFAGNGSALNELNAGALSSGTVPDARLSANVSLLQSGKLPDARLSANVALLDASQTFTGVNSFPNLWAVNYSGSGSSGGILHVGDNVPSADPKLIKFGDGSAVTIGENGADNRMELKATTFALLASSGSGYVGIGKTNPATALDVNGTVTATAFHGSSGAPLELKAKSFALLPSGGSGRVGIGKTNPATALDVEGTVTATEFHGTRGAQLNLDALDGSTSLNLRGDSSGAGLLSVNNSEGQKRVNLDGQSTFGGGALSVFSGNGTETVEILGSADLANTGGQMIFRQDDGTTSVQIDGEVGTRGGGWMGLYKNDGTLGITLQAKDGNGHSRITSQVIEITGGADLAERFDVSSAGSEPQPGMLVCIDPAHIGRLVVSARAYDRTVAGVISGAGGVNSGMVMSQHGSAAGGQHPVALTGRTYCLMDAGAGVIEPGDLITTSDTPGHGMKASDTARAQGAIIGKAMSGLREGKGLVLVLVTLQ